MSKLFDYPHIDIYRYDDLPLDCEMYLVDEKYIELMSEDFREPGTAYGVAPVIVAPVTNIIPTSRTESAMDFTLYSAMTRHHRLPIVLPRSEFVIAAGSSGYDIKPFVFVRSEWFENLCLRRYSTLALIDAAGVKERLRAGTLKNGQLRERRAEIDETAKAHPEIAFLSLADNVLLKSDWTFGDYETSAEYTYEPEALLRALPKVVAAFGKTLGLPVYTIVTQGENYCDESDASHVASTANHTSLNVLGSACAQLFAIDMAAKEHVPKRCMPVSDLYLDDTV